MFCMPPVHVRSSAGPAISAIVVKANPLSDKVITDAIIISEMLTGAPGQWVVAAGTVGRTSSSCDPATGAGHLRDRHDGSGRRCRPCVVGHQPHQGERPDHGLWHHDSRQHRRSAIWIGGVRRGPPNAGRGQDRSPRRHTRPRTPRIPRPGTARRSIRPTEGMLPPRRASPPQRPRTRRRQRRPDREHQALTAAVHRVSPSDQGEDRAGPGHRGH